METSDFKAPSHLNTAFGCLTLPAIFLALSTLMIDVSSRTWPQLNFEALPSLIKGPLIAVAFARMYAALALSQPYVYYAFVVGTLLIAGIVSIRLRQTLQIRLAAAAVAIGIIYFSTFYLSPVNPSAGYTIISPTEPTGLNRGLRFSQSLADVRPCRYTLLGWGDGHSSLYYSEQCDLFDDGPKQIKMYEMELGIPIVYDRPEAEVVREAYVKEAPDVIDKFDFSAESLENNWAQLHFVSDGLLSANQQHIAVVVKHLAYGPQEIVILTKQ